MRSIVGSGAGLGVLLLSALTFAHSQADEIAREPVFRAPFVLKLRIDNERYYEEHFNRIPYVMGNDVYLFAGENFGINVTITGNQITRITYQRDPAKGDVEFIFTQEKSATGLTMMLVTRNRLKRRLLFDALMTVPEKKEVYKTRVLPVEPTLTNFESWPHPIVQLVLSNFRFSESGSRVAQTLVCMSAPQSYQRDLVEMLQTCHDESLHQMAEGRRHKGQCLRHPRAGIVSTQR